MGVGGVGRSIGHSALGSQPRRQTAEVPLAADIRTGPENDVKVQLACQAHEFHQIMVARQVPLAFARFVKVPGNVSADAVESAALGFEQAVAPQLGRYAEVVYRSAD